MKVSRNGSNRQVVLLCLCLMLALSACATGRNRPTMGYGYDNASAGSGEVKDNKPDIWQSDHPRVRHFRNYYSRTRTVRVALENGQRYLPTITKVFEQQRLPQELAYLPMLESLFENRATSATGARGLWQFIPQTAKRMGLRVGVMVDDRLNWLKATKAAARYLDSLGSQFNYNWALALAAYNGGPNYVEQAMRSQRSWNFWDLRLRRETTEYVPRFIAMVQVARERYRNLTPTL